MIEMILAMNLNNTIGDKNGLTWKAPNDMRWFKDKTKGRTLICGRKTYNTLPESFKKSHEIIVLSRTGDYGITNVLKLDNPLIIGGGEIYSTFFPYADRVYLSIIPQIYYGDTMIEINWNEWNVVYSEGYDDALCMILEKIKGE